MHHPCLPTSPAPGGDEGGSEAVLGFFFLTGASPPSMLLPPGDDGGSEAVLGFFFTTLAAGSAPGLESGSAGRHTHHP